MHILKREFVGQNAGTERPLGARMDSFLALFLLTPKESPTASGVCDFLHAGRKGESLSCGKLAGDLGAQKANSARIGGVGKVCGAQASGTFHVFLRKVVEGLKEKAGFFLGDLQGKGLGLAKFEAAAGKFQEKRARFKADKAGFGKIGRRFGFAVFGGAPKSLFEAESIITTSIGNALRLLAV